MSSCTGPETQPDAGLSLQGDGGLVPSEPSGSSRDALVEFVNARGYVSWAAEAAVHGSTGPHGKVRSFVNPALYTSLKSGASVHPVGSVAVKELYAADSKTLQGHAVDIKTDAGWVFFEGFLPSQDQYYFVGTSNSCASCHQSGADYVTVPASAFP